MPRITQHSFAGGEIAPGLHARFDLAKHAVSLAKAFNVIIHPEGGVSNRAGNKFVQEIKDSTAVGTRLIRFAYNVEQQYGLEFGDYYMRVIRNGSYVYKADETISGATQADPVVLTVTGHTFTTGDEVYVESVVGMTELNNRTFTVTSLTANTISLQDKDGNDIDGTAFTAYSSGGTIAGVYEMTTPYAIGDVQLDPTDPTKPGLKFTQSADVMTITHKSYGIKELTRTDHNAWTLTDKEVIPGITGPTGISASGASAGSDTLDFMVTAVDNETGEESLPGRASTTTSISAATQADPCVITVGAAGTLAIGDEIEIDGVVGMTELNGGRYIVDAISGTDVTLRDTDSTGFTAYSSGGTVHYTYYRYSSIDRSTAISVSWTAATGADKYNIYQRENGLFGFVGSTAGTSFSLTNLEGDETDTPPNFRNPFDQADEYPQTTTYYEQRQVFGGSTGRPQGMDMSQSANFNNYTFSTPRRDSDAIARTIASRQVNEIRHFVPLQDLIVLTSGGEWRVAAGDGDVITPTSFIVKPQEYHGAAHIAPIVSGSRVLYVQRQGNIVRDLGYDLRKDGYGGNDMSLLAKHMFRGKRLVEWDYQEVHDNLVLCVRSDGVLVVMTYLPEQEVYAWTEHQTRGKYESVCVVEEDNTQVVYYIVKRTINGTTRRFIERQAARDFDHPHDQFFLDAALTYDVPITITGMTNADPGVFTTSSAHGLTDGDVVDISDVKGAVVIGTDDDLLPVDIDDVNKTGWIVANATSTTFTITDSDGNDVDTTDFRVYEEGGEVRKAVTTISGLRHLAGSTVWALANGDVCTALTVSSEGAVTLPFAASRVHVGLPYYAEIETLDVNYQDKEGETDSRKKRKGKAFLRVENTRGIQIGSERTRLQEVKQLLSLSTGIYGTSVPGGYDRQGRVIIRQPNPLGMTLLSIATSPETEDE